MFGELEDLDDVLGVIMKQYVRMRRQGGNEAEYEGFIYGIAESVSILKDALQKIAALQEDSETLIEYGASSYGKGRIKGTKTGISMIGAVFNWYHSELKDLI